MASLVLPVLAVLLAAVGLALLVALVVALVVALLAPVDVRFHLKGVAPLRGWLVVALLFGAWRRRFEWPAPTAAPPSAARAHDAPHAACVPAPRRAGQAGRAGRAGTAGLRWIWRDAALRRRLARRLAGALASLHWRALRLHARIGLEDPADTGQLWALVGPLGACLSSAAGRRGAQVRIVPAFVEPAFDVEAQGGLRFVPARLLWPLAAAGAAVGLALARRRIAAGLAA